jgi:hypothetical protein
VFEAIRGIRIFRTGNISLTYTNPFARTLRSTTSYKRYCLLNEINPTGGFQKMAFYTFFTLHSSKKLIIADSPRQVINALTLWSALKVDTNFWDTLKEISTENRNEALILYGMVISFFIWIFFITQLFFAIVFMIPVYYNILKKMNLQSLRQFVCITVDKTVNRLARKYQKESLKQRTNEYKNKVTYRSVDNLIEKPKIPDLKSKSSETSFNSYPRQILFNSVSTSSSFDSISNMPPTKLHSELSNTSREKIMSNRSRTFDDSDQPGSESIDVNPFRDPVIKRPKQIHPKTSTINLLTRQDEDSSFRSLYERDTTHSDSQQEFPDNSLYKAPLARYDSNYANSTNSLNQSVLSFENFVEDYNERNHSIQDEENEEDKELYGPDNTTSWEGVRSSLIIRARDMEFEDYSKFRPKDNDSAV